MKAEKLSDSVIDRLISMALKRFAFKKVRPIADITPPKGQTTHQSVQKLQEIMALDAIWWHKEAKTYQDVINTQKQTINQLRQKIGSDGETLATITDERDRLHGLLSVAKCPNCDGSVSECQWCDDRKYCMEPRN